MALEGRILKRANPNTIQDKFLVGYQGWFTCPGDGPPVHKGHHGWLHWFNKPIPDGGQPTIDLWPDVSDYTPDELFPVPWYTTSIPPSPSSSSCNCPSSCTLSTSEPHSHPRLFSSRHPKTVQRHFHWLAQHSVDGVFLQRFAGQCEADGNPHSPTADIMRLRDEVLDRVREAAEKEGRVWAIMYDVSGVPDDRIEKVIRVDWAHLLWEKRILESSYYLREQGRPVIALWGFGFSGRGHSPSTVRSIVHYIRSITPGGAYIMAGTPTHWATLRDDADPNPDFFPMWFDEFDAISPWTVGRFGSEESIDRFAREKLKPDLEKIRDPSNTRGRKVDYIPVIFPGSSGFNLSHGKWTFNEQPRDGGRFLWRQIYQVKRVTGARIVYGAMWDEYDEGTAFLPVVSKKRELPREGKFLALDVDGYDLPPDWYMRIAGFIGEIIRGEREVGETFPVKDLQDYWSSHPHYELLPAPGLGQPVASGSSSGESGASGSGGGAFEEWCAKEEAKIEDVPPPPYSLEATGSQPATARVGGSDSQAPQQQSQPQLQPQPNQTHQPPVPTQTRPTSLPTQPSSASPNSNSNWSQNQIGLSGRPASDGRPPVPLQSRPSLSIHPPPPTSLQHAHTYGHGPVPPPIASRPTSYPTSSSYPASDAPMNTNSGPSANVPYAVYNSRPPGTSGTSPRPGEAFHHPDYSPAYLPNAGPQNTPYQQQPQQPQQPNWNTRPRPSTSVSDLDERFRQQSLNERPYALTSPTSPSTGQQQQWPPPEWGLQPQPYSPSHSPGRPPSHPHSPSRLQAPVGSPPPLPPPPHPARTSPSHLPPPPLHPASRPSGSPWPHPAGVGPGSGMPSPGPGPGPGPGYGLGLAGFPAPHSHSPPAHGQSQPPYAQHMMPYTHPPHSHSGRSGLSSESVGAYPGAYPDVTQSWMGGGGGMPPSHGGRPPTGYGEQYGDGVGGFYPGPGMGTGYPPPHIPARPSAPPHVPSISPGQIMPSTSPAPAPAPSPSQASGPGGFIPGAGRFGELGSRIQSTGSKVMSADAWKRGVEGIGSLSSAGSKVYQKFRS